MRAPSGLAALAAASLLLAGCSSGPNETAPPSDLAKPGEYDETTGAIEGFVLNDEAVGVSGAQVGIVELNLTTVSDSVGAFSLSRVQPGEYDLLASRIFFFPKSTRVKVTAGAVERVEITLAPNVAEKKVPVKEVQHKSGIFGCGVTERDPTGLDGSVNACGLLALGEELDVDTTDTNEALHDWSLAKGRTADLGGLVFELKWTSTQAAGRAMRMTWEVDGCVNDINGEGTLGDVSGTSPLRVELNKSQVEKRLNLKVTTCNPDGLGSQAKNCDASNCTFTSRVWSAAELLGEASEVDMGITFQQEFDLYVTAFYHQPVPQGYSALNG